MANYTLGQTILYLDNVSAGYDGKIILKDVTLSEKDIIKNGGTITGQCVAFVGRSGRGKSTLFKVMTGLMKPMSGRILIPNMTTHNPEDALEVKEGDVGFVDQKYTLFRHKTVFNIMKYALRKSGKSKEEKKQIITEQLTKWGLIEHKDKYPCELSGGQRQRTAIIEQILTSKHFMIFDEPFSGLDVVNIEKVQETFKMILEDNELNTIIFSTHDVNLAVTIADSIYVIGFTEDNKDYSTIVSHYDLKEMGLSWTEYGAQHLKLVNQIKNDLRKS